VEKIRGRDVEKRGEGRDIEKKKEIPKRSSLLF